MSTTAFKLEEILTSSNPESDVLSWKGGYGAFGFTGTFGSAVGAMQVSFDNGASWTDIGSFYDIDGTDTTVYAFGPLPVCKLKLVLSGATGSTNLTGFIQ